MINSIWSSSSELKKFLIIFTNSFSLQILIFFLEVEVQFIALGVANFSFSFSLLYTMMPRESGENLEIADSKILTNATFIGVSVFLH